MNPTSGVIREAFELYKRHFTHFATIALIVYVAIAIVTAVLVALLSWIGIIISLVFNAVGTFWLQGALARAVEDVRDGKTDLSVGETFSSAQPHLGAIAGASILAGLAIAVGFVLLIIPGLILLTLWSLIVPVIVIEGRRAMESFGRSQQLVSGNGMNVFGVIALTFLIQIAAGFVLGLILAPLPDSAQGTVSQIVAGTLIGPFVATTWTLMYFRLREAKEGTATVGGGTLSPGPGAVPAPAQTPPAQTPPAQTPPAGGYTGTTPPAQGGYTGTTPPGQGSSSPGSGGYGGSSGTKPTPQPPASSPPTTPPSSEPPAGT